ncbi:hypothetical protein ABPG74_007800 [Tetrahymena malaccensis]
MDTDRQIILKDKEDESAGYDIGPASYRIQIPFLVCQIIISVMHFYAQQNSKSVYTYTFLMLILQFCHFLIKIVPDKMNKYIILVTFLLNVFNFIWYYLDLDHSCVDQFTILQLVGSLLSYIKIWYSFIYFCQSSKNRKFQNFFDDCFKKNQYSLLFKIFIVTLILAELCLSLGYISTIEKHSLFNEDSIKITRILTFVLIIGHIIFPLIRLINSKLF